VGGRVPTSPSPNGAARRQIASRGLTQEQRPTDPDGVKADVTSTLSSLSAVGAGAAKEECGHQLGHKVSQWPEKVVEALKKTALRGCVPRRRSCKGWLLS
jgi:hypothetical protein